MMAGALAATLDSAVTLRRKKPGTLMAPDVLSSPESLTCRYLVSLV